MTGSQLTLEDIANLINSNKDEIIHKFEGIAEEVKVVKAQVSELSENAKNQIIINTEVNKKLEMLEKEISELKRPQNQSSFLQTKLASVSQIMNDDFVVRDSRISEIISEGRRVIGLSPINESDISIEIEKGIDDEQNAMIAAAQTFFLDDMNIPLATVNKMKIIKAFRPVNSGPDNDKLYVEFAHESSVKIVHRFKRNLAAGLRIFLWFHPALYPRFKALDEEAYQLRKVKLPHHQTDIRYETNDIGLYKRLDKSHRWQKVSVEGLPEVCFDPDLLTEPCGSRPKGRARLNSKRKRESENSDEEEVCIKNSKLPNVDHKVDGSSKDIEPAAPAPIVSGETS